MNYKSPIELIMQRMQTQLEEEIFKAVQNVGVIVDKDQLLRALMYDRHQYQQGYSDRDAEIVRCKDCKHYDRSIIYCNKFGIQDIDDDWFCADGKRRLSENDERDH